MIYFVTNQTQIESDAYKIISVEESLQLLKGCKVLQYDSETNSLDCFIGKLLMIQFGNRKKDFQIVVDTTTVDVLNYKDILESTLLIGHNLCFDLKWLYNYKIIPRRVYDTMIVEQFLHLGFPHVAMTIEEYSKWNYKFPYKDIVLKNGDTVRELRYSLDAVANSRLGINIDKSIRGDIIWRGICEDTILYGAGDVTYLEDILDSQLKDCVERNCVKGAKLECDVVPAMAYLEWCGIKLDETKWKAKMSKDKINLENRLKALNDFIIKNNMTKYYKIDNQGDLFSGFSLEPQVTINWDSSQQVTKIVKELGFNTTVQDKKTGLDKDSVLEKQLSSQKGINDEFLKLYFDYKESSKVVSTYGQTQLNMIHPITGRCHTQYHQLGAASGRMSCGSNKPNVDLAKLKGIPSNDCVYCNFQQLPADEDTRSAFVAEEGNLFCSSDFSALESRLGADIYEEHSMIEEFLYNSGDIHSLVAKACFPELKDKTTAEIKKNYAHLRKKAKPIGFSQQFGGSAQAIASSLGCPLEEAETIAKAYLDGFPGIATFKAKGSKFVRNNGYVLMCKHTGHRMIWWDHNKWLERQKSFNSEFWDTYKQYYKGTQHPIALEVKEHFQAASKWDRMALNAPTQATGCIILKDAITTFFNYIVDNNLFNIVKICALVHDEANIEYPKDLDIDSVLKKCMEDSADKYCKSLPIPAEAAVGDHWIH
jgi:DNA polymerase I-like protein with 3'-5' exonuclease and polymerase domains